MSSPRAIRLGALAAVLVLTTSVMPVAAALLWTLTPSTASLSTGSAQTVRLTATNESLLDELGCVVLGVSGPFTIVGASIRSTTADGPWATQISGQSVIVAATGGGARLELLQSVTFDVVVLPTAPGIYTWSANAYRDQGCGGSALLGVGTVAVTVSGPAVTPTPAPTPTPTPTPAPSASSAPTASPTPSPSVAATSAATPTPAPTASSTPTPKPKPTKSSSPSAEPTASATPSTSTSGPASSPVARPAGEPGKSSEGAEPSPEADAGGQGGGRGGAGPQASPGGGRGASAGRSPSNDGRGQAGAANEAVDATAGILAVAGEVEGDPGAADVALGPLGVIDGITVWAVPAAIIAGPGLLVILAVAIQTTAAAAWIPAIRRMRGTGPDRAPSLIGAA